MLRPYQILQSQSTLYRQLGQNRPKKLQRNGRRQLWLQLVREQLNLEIRKLQFKK
jgi:hypothetical protein